MSEPINDLPKPLQQFQKLIVQNIYIKQLNKWLDELEWENEKKDTIIEMRENDILELKNQMSIQTLRYSKIEREFKEFTNKVKQSKVDTEKVNKQQDLINELKHKLKSTEDRLQIASRMNQLLARQKK